MHLFLKFLLIRLFLNFPIVIGNSVPLQGLPKPKPLISNESSASEFLDRFNREVGSLCHKSAEAEWNYVTDMTMENKLISSKAKMDYIGFLKQKSTESQLFDWKKFKDPLIARQFHLLSILGLAGLPESRVKKYEAAKSTMESLVSTSKVCDVNDRTKCDLSLEPELTEIFRNNRNATTLKDYWLQWRDVSGKKMRQNYTFLAEIIQEIAENNNFANAYEYDTKGYASPNLDEDMENIWSQLKPFYLELHAYIRRKLGEYYGTTIVPQNEPIPSHLLGNLWAQSWVNIFDIVVPYPKKSSIDVTPKMLSSNLSPIEMAKIGEDFFTSIGFPPLPNEFWNGSIFVKPKDKEIICHASAWDLCNGKDFRIKQCTRVNMEDLITLHHELGHIFYFIQYKDQPKLFREGANPAFHESIGDLIALSVQTPKHLYSINLLEHLEDDDEADINFLMTMALEKVVFLPYGLLVDKWRWNVFQGKTKPENYNCDWWKLRLNYQGVAPPVARSEMDFDPGAKYHIAANVGYIRYFMSNIIQFQFHQSLCTIAKQFDPTNPLASPLHKCDVQGNKDAGKKLMEVLQLGSSKPWPESMKIITGQETISAIPILDYFRPLYEWLKLNNKEHNVTVGWKEIKPACVGKNKKSIGAIIKIMSPLKIFGFMVLIIFFQL